jgi:hypothetical protein
LRVVADLAHAQEFVKVSGHVGDVHEEEITRPPRGVRGFFEMPERLLRKGRRCW